MTEQLNLLIVYASLSSTLSMVGYGFCSPMPLKPLPKVTNELQDTKPPDFPSPIIAQSVLEHHSLLGASYFSVVICNRISLSYSVQVLCSLFIIVLPLQFLYFCILSFESFLLGRISLPRSYFQEEVMRLYTLNF